jgi:hypothetical protein
MVKLKARKRYSRSDRQMWEKQVKEEEEETKRKARSN